MAGEKITGTHRLLALGLELEDTQRAVSCRHIQMIALRGGAASPHFELVRDFDLSSVIAADDQLNSALPDWRGNIWFVTRQHGVVGVVDRKTGAVLSHRELGSPIEN